MPTEKAKAPSQLPDDEILLTRREAAAVIRQNIQNIDKLIRTEKLPAYRPVGRRILIRKDELLRLVMANPVWKGANTK
jgi:excisionase family DNA binding protein